MAEATTREEVFGAPPLQAVQRRAAALWTLVEGDPRWSCHGRAVGLADPGTVAEQAALARLQGVGPAEGVPLAGIPARRAALEAEGLRTDAFRDWRGGDAAATAAEAAIAARPLPADLALVSVDAETPGEALAALDALTAACGVLLPMGAFLRGLRRPAVCLVARDREGRAVAASAAVAQFHPDHPRGGEAWWGMLATDSGRRREGLALALGARSLLAMRARHGIARVFTGIREGNAASERVCTALGLAPSEAGVVIAIDPAAFEGDRLTG